LGHVLGSFGISYLAQLLMALYPLLACISVAALEARETGRNAAIVNSVRLATSPGGVADFVPVG